MITTYRLYYFGIIGLLYICTVGCQQGAVQDDSDAIAKVHNRILKNDELLRFIPQNTSVKDSTALANSYIEQWIRESLMLREAERLVSADDNIEQLVSDYKSSLLRMKYEETIVREKMDSLITPAQLQQNYQENKSQYILEAPIIKAYLAKIEKGNPQLATFAKYWKDEKWTEARKLSMGKAPSYTSFQNRNWRSGDGVKALIPHEVLKKANIEKGTNLQMEDDKFKYFLKVFEYVDKSEEPPLEYITLQLKKVILHKRKQALLKNNVEALYESELRNNNIKVFQSL